MSFIAYDEFTGTVSDRFGGAVVVVIGGEKYVSDGAFGHVKLALN